MDDAHREVAILLMEGSENDLNMKNTCMHHYGTKSYVEAPITLRSLIDKED